MLSPVSMHKELKYGDYASAYDFIDEKIKAVVRFEKNRIERKDQDCLWLVGGEPGSGKTTFVHHIHTLYTIGDPSTERVAMDRQSFAAKLPVVSTLSPIRKRFFHFDEANVSKRQAMSTWNVDVIDLYMAIRGKRIFHAWCNPSLNIIDKEFIKERVKAVVWIFNKPKGRYIFLTRDDIISLVEKRGSLSRPVIERYGKEMALIKDGWFKDYPEGDFKTAYLEVKEDRQDIKIEQFKEKYGQGEVYSLLAATRKLKVDRAFLRNHINNFLVDKGMELSAVQSPSGHYRIPEELLSEISDYIRREKNGDGISG